ncbi:unnamed protein product, partial [Allacma fusca]
QCEGPNMDFMLKLTDFKKRFCRYLLNHYLGQYLEEKFTLDQLSVDLYNGKGSIKDVSLDCRALNQMAEEQNIPVEFLEVRLGTVSVQVPWKNIMQESCQIEVSNLFIAIQPKQRVDNGNSMLNSMFTSMASSMQLAEEFFKTVETEEETSYQGNQSMSGLEAVAKTIEAVLSRIKVNFQDSIIRVERARRSGAGVGVAVEMHIKSWNYSDESEQEENDDQKMYETAFSYKKFTLQGVKLYSDIFKFQSRDESYHSDAEEDYNLILIGNFTGQQEVRLRIKKDESMRGPQVSLDCSFGSLVSLLSPVQAHICYQILDDFINPPTSSSSENINRQNVKEKPMDSFDFERIKFELEEANRKEQTGFGMNLHGWSGNSDDCDDQFLPFQSKSDVFSSVHSTLMDASLMSGATSMQQSMSESTTSIGINSGVSYMPSPLKSSSGLIGTTSENTKFSISIASAAVVILHEDILTLSSAMAVAPSSVKEMKTFAGQFFQDLGITNASGRKQVEDLKAKLENACPKSFLQIIAAPVKLEGNTILENSLPITTGHISFACFELIESIKDNQLPDRNPENIVTSILSFPHNFEYGSKESLKIEFKHKAYRSKGSVTKLSIRVHLQECVSEFDMSVVDRINALLQPKLPQIINGRKLEESPSHLMNKSQSVVFVKVTSPKCDVDFRFPIPDMRKSDDLTKVPYWVRNLRSDSVIFSLRDLSFSTRINSNSDMLEFDTQCSDCQLKYKAFPADTPYHFATASCRDINNDDAGFSLHGFDRPRVIVCIYPERKSETSSDRSEEEDAFADYISMGKTAPSPFSSRRNLRECMSTQEDTNSGNFGESVVPGDREEMSKFMEDTVRNVMYRVECNLRSVQVNLKSREFFEQLYNRLSMDLLLWEPLAPKQTNLNPSEMFRGCLGPEKFSMCKSGIRIEPESDSEEELSFYSGPTVINAGGRNKREPKRILPHGQSEVTINLVITHGVCSFFTPFEDATGNIISDKKGQISLEVEQGNLFIVSGYKGNPNLGYLCLHSQKATFFHNDLVKSPTLLPRTDNLMKRTIYPSEPGVIAGRSSEGSSTEHQDMLSLAIKIEKDSIKNIKNFKVAIGVKDGTIDYRMTLPNRNWFTQIVDFFDVTDVTVPGYTPSAVITELHVHLWNCAASYTPSQLQMRCILIVENFSVSVNIAAQTNMKVVRFVAEDAALFLTNKKESADIRNDYVCVMDMDLFEILLRICLNRNNNNQVPQLDLKASNNILHIRTCSDSIKMLLEVLTYVAKDGDITSSDIFSDLDDKVPFPLSDFSTPSTNFMEEEPCSSMRERRLSHQQQQNQAEQLHCMVAEAMKENLEQTSRVSGLKHNSRSRTSSDGSTQSNSHADVLPSPGSRRAATKQCIEIHFEPEGDEDEEPEESNVPTPAPPHYPDDPIMESCNGLPVSIQLSDDDEEEFYILENDPGVGFLPRFGEPEVRVLATEPIEIIDNYFTVPMGKVDILQAPRHYPKPVIRYTVQEMSMVWHLYGGEDFGSGSGLKGSIRNSFAGSSETLSNDFMRGDSYDRSDEVDLAIDALNPGAVVFSKTKAFESAWEAYESPKIQRKHSGESGSSWRVQGGRGRRHDVLVELQLSKVKFQHEVYPQNTEQASRQVLVINSVEIKDKLKSSQFNKMLYLYTSSTLPKQSYANMVVIKAAHLRPDPHLNMEECCLKVSLLPIRLNIDQDTLLFLYQFFSDLASSKDEDDDSVSSSSARPPSHTPSVESLPVMMVNTKDEEYPPGPASSSLEEDTNLLIFTEDPTPPQDDTASVCSKDPSVDSFKSSAPIYFRELIFSPDVPIRLDYRGKNVYNMTNGPIQGILMALGQLDSAEFRLIRLSNNRGVLGIGKLVNFLATEWIADIKKNQVPSVLGGVDIFIPMHSFVQLFQGVKNLFYLPVEQYQKDGRLAKGLQRGVSAFSTSAAMAVLKLTNRMVQALQGAAEFTYDMVSPGPSVQQQRRQSSAKKKRPQPSDIREGVTNAYNVVREGLGDTAHTIVRVASKENEQKGVPGAVGGVLRQIPPTLIVKPIILVAEATSNVLEGFRSQLEPEFKKEAEEKWKD